MYQVNRASRGEPHYFITVVQSLYDPLWIGDKGLYAQSVIYERQAFYKYCLYAVAAIYAIQMFIYGRIARVSGAMIGEGLIGRVGEGGGIFK